MIKFYLDKETVKVVVEAKGLKTDSRYPHFSYNAGNELNAELLAKYLEETTTKIIQEIREDAYNEGYKLGRGKKKKWSWTPNTWGFRYKKD